MPQHDGAALLCAKALGHSVCIVADIWSRRLVAWLGDDLAEAQQWASEHAAKQPTVYVRQGQFWEPATPQRLAA